MDLRNEFGILAKDMLQIHSEADLPTFVAQVLLLIEVAALLGGTGAMTGLFWERKVQAFLQTMAEGRMLLDLAEVSILSRYT